MATASLRHLRPRPSPPHLGVNPPRREIFVFVVAGGVGEKKDNYRITI